MKEFSNWQNFPQVYLKKKFLGDSETFKSMHADGTLEELLLKEKII